MALENKLGITDSVELARVEERISKKKALELFESGYLDSLQSGTWQALAEIHAYLLGELYAFAGKMRNVNLTKGIDHSYYYEGYTVYKTEELSRAHIADAGQYSEKEE